MHSAGSARRRAGSEPVREEERVMDEMPPGATWFLRCADCEEMYVASSGFSMVTGGQVVYWMKPRPTRAPKKCKHEGAVQRWNGAEWVDASVRRSQEPTS